MDADPIAQRELARAFVESLTAAGWRVWYAKDRRSAIYTASAEKNGDKREAIGTSVEDAVLRLQSEGWS